MTDPFSPEIGLAFPKTLADIVTVSHQHDDHNNIAAVEGTSRRTEPFIISGPGEYEVSGVFIYGIPSFHDSENGTKRGENTIYIINVDGIKLAHLGDLGHRLSEAQLEEINGVDVLMIPVGGIYTLNAAEAVKVVSQVEPKIVIPMHYKLPGLKFELDPLKNFLKEIGLEGIKSEDKLVIYKEKLPEERQVVILNARSQSSSA